MPRSPGNCPGRAARGCVRARWGCPYGRVWPPPSHRLAPWPTPAWRAAPRVCRRWSLTTPGLGPDGVLGLNAGERLAHVRADLGDDRLVDRLDVLAADCHHLEI